MKLSKQVLLGLKRLGNQALVSNDCFDALVEDVLTVLTNTKRKSKLNELTLSKPDIVKEGYASLMVLLIESTRHNLDPNALISTLENYNLNISRLSRIGQLYGEYRYTFQLSLESIGTSYSRISDVKWRLDFCIMSSSLENESCPMYLLEIVTETVTRTSVLEELFAVRKCTFVCSLQQLQELVSKLKEATRLIHSIANVK